MTIKDRVDDILDHFDYAVVKTTGYDFDNVLAITNATPQQLKRYLHIVYGTRVEKVKGGFKIKAKIKLT